MTEPAAVLLFPARTEPAVDSQTTAQRRAQDAFDQLWRELRGARDGGARAILFSSPLQSKIAELEREKPGVARLIEELVDDALCDRWLTPNLTP